MRHQLSNILLLVVLAAFLWSCDEEVAIEEPGGLSIQWRINPLGCLDSGVQIITAEIHGPSAPAEVVYPCDNGRTLVDNLTPGRYRVRLYGVDASGRATFASAEINTGVSSGTITPVEPIQLTAKAARVEISWFFQNGRLCAQNGVTEVTIGVYDYDAYAIDEQSYECGTARGAIDGLHSGAYLIHVLGKGADGVGLFEGLTPLDLRRGEEATIEVEMQSCEEDC